MYERLFLFFLDETMYALELSMFMFCLMCRWINITVRYSLWLDEDELIIQFSLCSCTLKCHKYRIIITIDWNVIYVIEYSFRFRFV